MTAASAVSREESALLRLLALAAIVHSAWQVVTSSARTQVADDAANDDR